MTDKEWEEVDAVWTSGGASWVQPVSEQAQIDALATKNGLLESTLDSRDRNIETLSNANRELIAELARVRDALESVMRYPDIRNYMGRMVSEKADAALSQPPEVKPS